jgi:hypothetical protein
MPKDLSEFDAAWRSRTCPTFPRCCAACTAKVPYYVIFDLGRMGSDRQGAA